MDNYTLSAIRQAQIVQQAYNDTLRYVQSEISKILRHTGSKDTLAYEYRIRRLNALLARTQKKMQSLYGVNLIDTTAFLKRIIPEAYYHTIFDVAQGIGTQPVFSAVNDRLINKIINEDWSGDNYSKRIWSNTNKLAEDIRQVLTTAAMDGESIYKTSNRLAAIFNRTAYINQRLIRTETTYACNQAELQSYDALDIDKYEFVATLDSRTSQICQKLDGEIFETKDAQAGKNLPAMHPNCRSTTIPYFEEGMPKLRTARDKDGKRITVPASMKYEDWYKTYIDPQGTPKPPKGNNTPKAVKPPQNAPQAAEIIISEPSGADGDYTDVPIKPKK